MSGEYLYGIRYMVEPNNKMTKAQLQEGGWGGCDAIVLCSIVDQLDESRTFAFAGVDAEGSDLSGHELFKVWGVLASTIGEDETAHGWQRELCQLALEAIRTHIGVGPPR